MAYYNSVGTPRFYVNIVEWLMNNGVTDDILFDLEIYGNLFRTLPVTPMTLSSSVGASLKFNIPNIGSNGFVAVLGHNMESTKYLYEIYEGQSEVWEWGSYVSIGSVVIGKFFEMSHSPDLNLTLEYQTGTKTIETRGGASLSNTMAQPPKWGDNLAQWELSDPNSSIAEQSLVHKSRRIWSLSFSFLSKESTFPKYNALNRYTNANLSDTDLLDNAEETLLDSDNFMSQVWEKVGTASPFIFQPDKDTPEFAIAKFVDNSLKVTQVAHQIYTIRVTVREVW